ncbi:Fructose-bisphosphate aldolase, class-I [Trema orientale]|uniref:fructose-bisphosphate aldolase n=1 Tax=Trema orientale TaxID=63057 RepID=A0A2P5FNZ3_TREOI|nr:Fructose-bisphosphate aldolase, class-I [Trema orientale]
MVTPGADGRDKATPEQFVMWAIRIRGYTELERNEHLYNTCLKKWGGRPENVKKTQDALLVWAKANSPAQLGKYTGDGESEGSNQGMFVKGFVY